MYCTATRPGGEIVTDLNGVRHICANDGNFYRLANLIVAPAHATIPAGSTVPVAGLTLGS